MSTRAAGQAPPSVRWDKWPLAVNVHPYPHLSPELQRLTDSSLRLWGDARVRHEALAAVVDAWETGSRELRQTIGRIDAAVVEGLRALGLPRGPVRGVRIDSVSPGLSGQKLRDCTIVLVGESMRTFIRTRNQADPVFRTWIHESLHARRPYSPGATAEYRAFRGYEEGLVEGLTQAILAAARIDLEALLRALWRSPAGEVRQCFPEAVATLHETATGRALPSGAEARLKAIADTLFGTDRGSRAPDSTVLAMLWRRAFV